MTMLPSDSPLHPDDAPLAVVHRDGRGPTIVFLPGYASDMTGSKAVALDAWAERSGRSFVRFDYRGCGDSGGAFADQTIETWFEDVCGVIDAIAGPVLLVGSSMGGWLMLLAALARRARIVGLVGIAAAPDFTEWGFDEGQKAAFARGEDLIEPSAYGEPMLTTARFWASGQRNLLRDRVAAIDLPIRLLHGQRDADVPWEHSLKLGGQLGSADVQVILIKDGDHRLSRAQDIALLIATLETLMEPM